MKKVILNLGCGKTRIPNSIGVDKLKIDGYTDVVHDLNIVPYPFKDDYVDEIHAYHILEHLDSPMEKLEEFHRILKPRGVLHLRVPYFSSMGAFLDITHKRPFAYLSFDCFKKDRYHHFYTEVEYEILKREIKYFGLYPNSGLYEKYIHPNQCVWYVKPFVRFINFLIKLNPIFFERIWCYQVGGAAEIVFTLRKPQRV